MVKRILSLLNKEISGLHQAAYLLAFFSLLAQFLGLIRDRLLAHMFGAGELLDVYYASFRIPDFIFVTVASLASLSILVPILVQKIAVNKKDAQVFIQSIFSFFFFVIIFVSGIAWLIMPLILPKVFPGITGEAFNDLLRFSRLLLVSPILLGISNIYASVTQALGRFVIYAMSPILYNAGIIVGIIFFTPVWGIDGVIYGVLIGALFHMLIQIPFLLKEGFLPHFSRIRDMKTTLSVFTLSIPRTIALATTHISILVLLSIASLLSEGSITVFAFSFNLQSVPLSLIGVSYSLAVFPTLSRLYNESNMKEFLYNLVVSLKHIIFWSVPCAVLFIVLRAQIVRTILGSGEFSWDATRLTAALLAIFVVSVVFQGIILLFVRSYYAIGKTIKPLVVNIIGAIVTISSSYAFLSLFRSHQFFRDFLESLLRVSDVPGTEVLALALGFSLGSLVNGLVLWILCRADFGSFTRLLHRTLFEVFSASIVMGFVAYIGLSMFAGVFETTTTLGIFLQGLCAGILGIFAGLSILTLLKSQELKEMKGSLSKKLFKASVVGPDAEVV